MSKAQRYVVVTTEFRGVFFGEFEKYDAGARTVFLKDAANCISWTSHVRGFLGLAKYGPSCDCKVGPKVPKLMLEKVTSISDCTKEAVLAWKKASK